MREIQGVEQMISRSRLGSPDLGLDSACIVLVLPALFVVRWYEEQRMPFAKGDLLWSSRSDVMARSVPMVDLADRSIRWPACWAALMNLCICHVSRMLAAMLANGTRAMAWSQRKFLMGLSEFQRLDMPANFLLSGAEVVLMDE
jgi:hypothetical protein